MSGPRVRQLSEASGNDCRFSRLRVPMLPCRKVSSKSAANCACAPGCAVAAQPALSPGPLPTCLPIRIRHINGASRSACVCARAHSGFPASPSPGRTWCPPSTSPPAWSSATASPSNAAGAFHRPRPPTSSPCPALPSILSPEMSPSGHSVSSVIVKHGSGEERLSKSPPPCLFVLRLIRETDLQLRLVVEKRFRASGAERPDSDHGLPDGPPVPYRRPAPPQPVPLHAGEPLPPRGAHGDP